MRLLLVAIALAGLGLPSAAHATPRAIVAAPGSAQARTFATAVLPMHAASSLELRNLDASFHSIRSEAIGPDGSSWCGPLNPGPEGPGNPRRFALGSCPLFWSDLVVPLTGSRPVLGIEALQPGRAYGFVCGVHPSMEGVLIT